MLLKLVLDHFRNYEHQSLEFDGGVNALIGANGQGKTNILEAIYYLSLLRSFRTTQLSNLLFAGTGQFSLYGEVRNSLGQMTRLGVSHGIERKLMLDGRPVHKSSDFISRLICAPFLPEDLAIIKGPPGGRRRFLDIALCQMSPQYLRALQEFNDALHSRNAMLKTPGRYPKAVVTAYDQVLADRASMLEILRQELARKLNSAVARQSETFFPDGRKLAVNFVSGIGRLLEAPPEEADLVREKYLLALNENYERDCRLGTTNNGPQRSDLACMLNGRSLANYGSEGECRTAAIALRLALLEILKEEHGENEITILVDDVLGELDETRRQAFLSQVIAGGQVIFAGTELPKEFPKTTKGFIVERGEVHA